MGAKEQILGKIRRSIGVEGGEIDRRAAVADRMTRTPKGVVPKRAALPHPERVALFKAMAEKVSASVVEVARREDVPAAIADYLRSKNLPQAIRRGDDPRLAGLPWSGQPQMDVKTGPSDGRDLVGLSAADAAIAETATLVLTSGADNPTTLNFLPDHHLVVVSADDVVGDMETVWEAVRTRFGKGVMPRTVNFVTGPSRSGDIEQTILLGAHGPRALHILLVG